jgi:hypothetical protein
MEWTGWRVEGLKEEELVERVEVVKAGKVREAERKEESVC